MERGNPDSIRTEAIADVSVHRGRCRGRGIAVYGARKRASRVGRTVWFMAALYCAIASAQHRDGGMPSVALAAAAQASPLAVRGVPQVSLNSVDPQLQEMTASALLGRDVHNLVGQQVGEVQQIIVGNPDHTVYALVAVGGFLGLAEHTVPFPVDLFSVKGERLVLLTELSARGLKQTFLNYKVPPHRVVDSQQTIGGAVEQALEAFRSG